MARFVDTAMILWTIGGITSIWRTWPIKSFSFNFKGELTSFSKFVNIYSALINIVEFRFWPFELPWNRLYALIPSAF